MSMEGSIEQDKILPENLQASAENQNAAVKWPLSARIDQEVIQEKDEPPNSLVNFNESYEAATHTEETKKGGNKNAESCLQEEHNESYV